MIIRQVLHFVQKDECPLPLCGGLLERHAKNSLWVPQRKPQNTFFKFFEARKFVELDQPFLRIPPSTLSSGYSRRAKLSGTL
jgi:hypothetical protein